MDSIERFNEKNCVLENIFIVQQGKERLMKIVKYQMDT